ncbi:hypothetical protein TNIN_366841 [Trichonephila inaurata madagascariensis]|uniref:Uncharacterized protein n=1 Tax=Trichonephila inaurata madagascariensis TaxID=2747483 RepID=A0A8X6MJI2_9ARAC|nr:hypothetical protein TNIN_366841 [Trichonephila inaurata madagascariensis]
MKPQQIGFSRKLGWMWICKKNMNLNVRKFSLGSIEYVPKRRGQQEMSWATIVDFYARLREVTEIFDSHHDKRRRDQEIMAEKEDEVFQLKSIAFTRERIIAKSSGEEFTNNQRPVTERVTHQ